MAERARWIIFPTDGLSWAIFFVQHASSTSVHIHSLQVEQKKKQRYSLETIRCTLIVLKINSPIDHWEDHVAHRYHGKEGKHWKVDSMTLVFLYDQPITAASTFSKQNEDAYGERTRLSDAVETKNRTFVTSSHAVRDQPHLPTENAATKQAVSSSDGVWFLPLATSECDRWNKSIYRYSCLLMLKERDNLHIDFKIKITDVLTSTRDGQLISDFQQKEASCSGSSRTLNHRDRAKWFREATLSRCRCS